MPLTLLFGLLVACAAPDGWCGEVIAVTTSTISDEDGEEVQTGNPCYETDPSDGSADMTGCCPEGWVFLAMGGDPGTVLCEEDCS